MKRTSKHLIKEVFEIANQLEMHNLNEYELFNSEELLSLTSLAEHLRKVCRKLASLSKNIKIDDNNTTDDYDSNDLDLVYIEERLEHCESLIENATKGPWVSKVVNDIEGVYEIIQEENPLNTICQCNNYSLQSLKMTPEQVKNNVRLIKESVIVIPQLIDIIYGLLVIIKEDKNHG